MSKNSGTHFTASPRLAQSQSDILTCREIREIRLRSGWTVTEMARRMGASSELILNWESGASVPDSEVIHQLRYIAGCLDSYYERIVQLPIADQVMEANQLSQVTHDDLRLGKTSSFDPKT